MFTMTAMVGNWLHQIKVPRPDAYDALAVALELDMRKWWTADGPSYFNHVSKGRILEVVTEAVDANAASPLAGLKKEAAVKGAEQTVAGTGWLPSILQTRMPVEIAPNEAAVGEEQQRASASAV